jgi:hypothetical protein
VRCKNGLIWRVMYRQTRYHRRPLMPVSGRAARRIVMHWPGVSSDAESSFSVSACRAE